jgi:hypothetical protein
LEKEELLDLANDPRFIPGIFNYCDRWCQRCTMTTRCLLYATLEDTNYDSAELDIHNAEFWQELQQIFQQTLELIKSWAEEHGVDLEAAVRDADIADIASRKDRAGNHELVQAARRYADSVERWFSEQFSRAESALVEGAVQSDERDASSAAMDLDEHTQDAVEIIRWYQHQIMVKLFRGLSGDEEEASVENNWQRDADGSVKVALIGMDRSIMAWGTMLRAFPDGAADIHPILLSLEQLRRRAEQAFPRAREFTRPGFDISPLVS